MYNKTSIKKIFSPSNKIHREVGQAKDLSAPRYLYIQNSAINFERNLLSIRE